MHKPLLGSTALGRARRITALVVELSVSALTVLGIAVPTASPALAAADASAASSFEPADAQQALQAHRAQLVGLPSPGPSSSVSAAVTRRPQTITLSTCNANELINAINQVNPSGGTVVLRPRCTYTLTGPVDNDQNGLPLITNSIRINGNGDTIRRDARPATPDLRIFDVGSAGNLTLNNLTVSNGHADFGGGIYVAGCLTTTGTRIIGNTANVFGGGLFLDSGSTATFHSTSILGNTAALDSGGMDVNGPAGVTLNGSALAGNRSGSDGGGIGNFGATVTATATSFTGNTAVHDGGGIFSGGNVTLRASAVVSNRAGDQGGGIYNTGGTVTRILSPVVGNIPDQCTGCSAQPQRSAP